MKQTLVAIGAGCLILPACDWSADNGSKLDADAELIAEEYEFLDPEPYETPLPKTSEPENATSPESSTPSP